MDSQQDTSTRPSWKRRLFAGIVRQRKPIIILFVILTIAAGFASRYVGVDYDISDYLPADAASSQALDVMDSEFGDNIANARVMVKNVSISQALKYKQRIEKVHGVTSVTWLDDAVSLSVPLEAQDKTTVETYYKDRAALFSVSIASSEREQAVSDIRAIIGDGNAMTGSAVSTAVATTSTVKQVAIITVIAIAFILLILIVTTTTWIEPLIVLVGLGVSVLLNRGSNLIFGTVSFVTNAAGTILQVAIALDFCVFLLHRYAETRGTTGSVENDMVEAMDKSSTAIISSACTVIIGFLALCAMRFRIGPDLGLALAKGILISLIMVFTFMPALFVSGNTLLVRTAHRPFIPSTRGFARVTCAVAVPLAAVFLLLPAPAYLASTSSDINYYYGSSHIFGANTQYGKDTQAITDKFGQTDTYALLVPRGDTGNEQKVSAELHKLKQVRSVISYVDNANAAIPTQMVSKSTLSKLESAKYSRMVITVNADYEGSDTFALVAKIRAIAQRYYPGGWYLAGEGVSTTDLMSTITEDKSKVDAIAIIAVIVVLIFATQSLSLPVILVFVIETSIWLNFSVPYFTGQGLFYMAYLIVSTIQLGVTVDYAILLTDRYKEFRQAMGKRRALRETVAATVIPASTSGVTIVVVGFLMSVFSTHGVLAQLGHYLATGVLMSLIAVLLVLPGFLYALDWLIAHTTRHARFTGVTGKRRVR